MDTKSEKMRALTCEATLVSLVIEDIFQDKADERTVNLLRLLAGRSEGVVWKEISLSELKARFAFYRDCFEDEVLALLQEFMNFTAALEADDMTDDFVIEAAPIIVFRERENDEDELYRNMVLQSLKGGGLPN